MVAITEQKKNFILIGLIGISVIFFFLFIQAQGSKQLLQREKNELKSENMSLSKQLDKVQGNLRSNEDKISSLNRDLERLSSEKADLESRYDLVIKAKNELQEKLKSQAQAAPQAVWPAQPQIQAMPQTSDAYWAEILKEKADLEMQLDKLRSEFKSVQLNNEQLQREKDTLELNVNNLTQNLDNLNREIGYNKKLMDSIAQELVRERNDKIQIQDSYGALKRQNAVLLRKLDTLTKRKSELEKQTFSLQDEKDIIERRFNEMQAMLTDKLAQVNSLKEQLENISSGAQAGESAEKKERESKETKDSSVELPPIVVRPAQVKAKGQESSADSLMGQVLAINKENNFVIVDLGEDTGIKPGDTIGVYRGSERIGTVEVVKTSKSVSACDIKKETTPIKIGDTIR